MIKLNIILIVMLALLLGGSAGYFAGFTAGLSWSFDKAMILLDKQGITIEFDENMIKNGLFQYKNNIGGCLFTDNLKNGS